MTGLAPRAALGTRIFPQTWHRLVMAALACLPLTAAGGSHVEQALQEAYYDYEVAGYCSLVSAAVAEGFRREVQRIQGDTVIDGPALDRLRGKAWQAAHWEWQNRGLGGYRAWCRNEGKASAERFLAVPP
jgi:hypothetical protein